MRNSEKVIGRVGGAVEERGGDREEGRGRGVEVRNMTVCACTWGQF